MFELDLTESVKPVVKANTAKLTPKPKKRVAAKKAVAKKSKKAAKKTTRLVNAK